jgi:hypothetical protein
MIIAHRLCCRLCAFLLLILLGGCVAEKTSTVHNTLKGDNSVEQAMAGSVDLPASGYTTLAELTDHFCRDLAKEAPGRKLYLDRANIRDVNTGDVANFSAYLLNQLESSLSKTFQLQVVPDEAELLLGAQFQLYGNQIKVFFKYHTPDFTVNRSLDYGIERDRLPQDSLRENLRSKAYRLAANILEDDLPRKIYIKPIESTDCCCISQFSRIFAGLVKTEIVRMHRQVDIVDEKPVLAKLSDTRAVRKKAKEVKELAASDAFFVDADTVLEGEYTVNGDQVMVTLVLKDLEGRLVNSCAVDIDRAIIKIPLEDSTASKLADLVDRKNEKAEKTVKLSTTRSGDSPLYREGEKIVFYAQVKKPLYLYIYTIDSRGEVSQLYPLSIADGSKMVVPGSLVAIPEPSDDFEFFVEPPFGKDAVKVFASPIALPMPEISNRVATRSYQSGVRAIGVQRREAQHRLAAGKTINPSDLVDYYRGLATRFGIEIAEDSMMVETAR